MDNVLKNGSKVTLLDTDVKATIIGISIRGIDNITIEYHVQWMHSGGISDAWLFSFQVKEYIDNSQPAGMENYESSLTMKK